MNIFHMLYQAIKSINSCVTFKSYQCLNLYFDMFPRHFHLRLRKHRSVISTGFRVVSVEGDGTENVESLPTSDYYTGYDLGKTDQYIYVSFELKY